MHHLGISLPAVYSSYLTQQPQLHPKLLVQLSRLGILGHTSPYLTSPHLSITYPRRRLLTARAPHLVLDGSRVPPATGS